MLKYRKIFYTAFLLFGSAICVAAQGLSTKDISTPTREYRPSPGIFVGVGGGLNLGVNGNAFKSREFSGMGAGTGLDFYAGTMTRKGTWGFGLGFQGLTISDQYVDYGKRQYLYAHADVYLRLSGAFVPYLHVGAAFSKGISPAGGIGVMFPIKMSENIQLVPNIKFSAVRGTMLSDDASTVGMVTSATIGLRFNIGKEGRRKKAAQRVAELMPEPEPIHDTITVIVRDTVTVKEREFVVVQQEVSPQEKLKNQEEKFNRDLSGAVLFETGSSTLTFAAKRILDEVAYYILETPGLRTIVEGHTDDVGGDDYNIRLSRNRAAAVVDYLVMRGVNPFMITSVGYGKNRPIAPNSSAENRQRNRRVEIHFSQAGEGK